MFNLFLFCFIGLILKIYGCFIFTCHEKLKISKILNFVINTLKGTNFQFFCQKSFEKQVEGYENYIRSASQEKEKLEERFQIKVCFVYLRIHVLINV